MQETSRKGARTQRRQRLEPLPTPPIDFFAPLRLCVSFFPQTKSGAGNSLDLQLVKTCCSRRPKQPNAKDAFSGLARHRKRLPLLAPRRSAMERAEEQRVELPSLIVVQRDGDKRNLIAELTGDDVL